MWLTASFVCVWVMRRKSKQTERSADMDECERQVQTQCRWSRTRGRQLHTQHRRWLSSRCKACWLESRTTTIHLHNEHIRPSDGVQLKCAVNRHMIEETYKYVAFVLLVDSSWVRQRAAQYRSFWTIFLQVLITQPTVSNHWRRVVSNPDSSQSNQACLAPFHATIIQYACTCANRAILL